MWRQKRINPNQEHPAPFYLPLPLPSHCVENFSLQVSGIFLWPLWTSCETLSLYIASIERILFHPANIPQSSIRTGLCILKIRFLNNGSWILFSNSVHHMGLISSPKTCFPAAQTAWHWDKFHLHCLLPTLAWSLRACSRSLVKAFWVAEWING